MEEYWNENIKNLTKKKRISGYENPVVCYLCCGCIYSIIILLLLAGLVILSLVIGWAVQIPSYEKEGNPMANDFKLIFTSRLEPLLCFVYGALIMAGGVFVLGLICFCLLALCGISLMKKFSDNNPDFE